MQTRKALFLDRDGVINVNHGYVFETEKLEFIAGIFELIKRFVAQGFLPVIVTNQSGIARGYFTELQFYQFMQYMQTQFDAQGLPSIAVYYCPHHPEFTRQVSYNSAADASNDCGCRKPKPGLILEACSQLNLDAEASVLIGDKLTDMIAAKAAGIGRKILFEPKNQQTSLLSGKSPTNLTTSDFEVVSSLSAIGLSKSD